MSQEAWLIIWTDISQETGYSVYLTEAAALEAAGEAISHLAQQDLDTIDWDDPEDKKALFEIVEAADTKRWADVIEAWDVWRGNKGPLDKDVQIVETTVFS